MVDKINRWLDKMSNYLAQRKGLLPLVGVLLVAGNLFLQVFPGSGWVAETDLLLHVGVILAVIGILLAWAL